MLVDNSQKGVEKWLISVDKPVEKVEIIAQIVRMVYTLAYHKLYVVYINKELKNLIVGRWKSDRSGIRVAYALTTEVNSI